jgi:hypothetical protein
MVQGELEPPRPTRLQFWVGLIVTHEAGRRVGRIVAPPAPAWLIGIFKSATALDARHTERERRCGQRKRERRVYGERERDMRGTRGETVMTEQEALTCCRDVRASDECQQPYEQQERQHKKRCPPAGRIFILGLLLQGPWCVRLQRPCMRVDGWSRVIFCFASLIQFSRNATTAADGWLAGQTSL